MTDETDWTEVADAVYHEWLEDTRNQKLAAFKSEIDDLLSIWQCNFDSGVRPDDDEPDEQALWDRIVSVREALANFE